MRDIFLIPPSLFAYLKEYAGDDAEALMAKAMLARGELVEMPRIVIREAPLMEDLTVRAEKTPDQQSYLNFGKHWKGGRR